MSSDPLLSRTDTNDSESRSSSPLSSHKLANEIHINLDSPHFNDVLSGNRRHSLLRTIDSSMENLDDENHETKQDNKSSSSSTLKSSSSQSSSGAPMFLDLDDSATTMTTNDFPRPKFTREHSVERNSKTHQLNESMTSLVEFDLTDDTLRSLFNVMDVNRDGLVTFTQFRQCLRDRGVKGSDEKFKMLFRITDQDNDGHVSFQQFVQAVQTIQMHFFYDKKRVSDFMEKKKNQDNETRVSIWAYNRRSLSLSLSLLSLFYASLTPYDNIGTRVEKWTPTEFSQNHQSFFFNEMPKWAAVRVVFEARENSRVESQEISLVA